MRQSWDIYKARAAAFAKEWASETYERGEAQTFYNELFEIFGQQRRGKASFEARVKLAGARNGRIDCFWPGNFLAEHKSAGADLIRARAQAIDYLTGIRNEELPRYILVCDFQTFDLTDLETGDQVMFALRDLPAHIEKFGFIVGVEKRVFRDQDPANIIAAELMGKLHDALKEGGYEGAPLERLLVRLLFCLFADDTSIFERDSFERYINERTNEDGGDLGPKLNLIFQVLNAPDESAWRRGLEEELRDFPYVNGELFAEILPIANFSKKTRDRLLEACGFHWGKISPAIFGSLFQSVMDKKERRKQGAHYTTEKNILKVIEPLFLDELRAELAHALTLRRDKRQRLEQLHDKIAKLKFLDPACGCGNFLVIAYRELRELELQILHEMFDRPGEHERLIPFDPVANARVNVDQFAGIELSEFPVRIAETAMWMMDHIMNVKLSLEFHKPYIRIPLKKTAHIVHGDALEIEWDEVLAPEACSYVMGNPPFIGAKMQTPAQRAQVIAIADLGGGTLDYVAAWFVKAGEYVNTTGGGGGQRIAFVATNSITQGEQVGQLWPILFERFKLEIAFAHRTFAWGSDARGKAHVHVVVLGLARADDEPAEKRLFSYPDINGDPVESKHSALSPYLFDASKLPDRHLVIFEQSAPFGSMPRLKTGVQMIDDGILTFEEADKVAFVAAEPGAEKYFRTFLGGDEFINGFHRWILYLRDISPSELRALPMVQERVKRVRAYREASSRPSTVALEATHVGVDERLGDACLAVPNTSSETRDYIPIGWLGPEVIANQKLRILPAAEPWIFALLTSRMHMAWMRAITGRMKSDYMYSVGVVYNAFPWPGLDEPARSKLNDLAKAVIAAREKFPSETLAALYDPEAMPPDLRRAHRELDAAVDRLYRREPFADDRARVEHLFGLYEKLAAPLIAASRAKRGKRGKR